MVVVVQRSASSAGGFTSQRAEDTGDDSLSLSSSLRSRATSGDDVVSLVAHGICDVGLDISRDLVAALQRRLDDATLKVLLDLLHRNRMCKLLAEDVQVLIWINCS